MKKPTTLKLKKLTVFDIAAMISLIAVVVIYVLAVTRSVGPGEESYYLSFPHRMMFGDKLLYDEWHVTQSCAVFHYLPFLLYYKLTGGTEGIILYFRCIFVITKILLFIMIYHYIKKRSAPVALISAVIITCFNDLMYLTVNYYYLHIFFFTISCLLIFIKESPSKRDLFIAGFLYACSVIAQPATALLWLVYAAAVLVFYTVSKTKRRQDAPAYPFDKISFAFITAGILAAAAVTLIFVFAGTDISDLPGNLKAVLSDSEHSFGLSFISEKISDFIGYSDFSIQIFTAVAIAVSIIKKLNPNSIAIRILLVASLFAYAAYAVKGIIDALSADGYYHFLFTRIKPVYVFFFCIPFIAASNHRERSRSLFYIVSVVSAFSVFFTSNLSGGAIICSVIPAGLIVISTVKEYELFSLKKDKLHKITTVIVSASLALILSFESLWTVMPCVWYGGSLNADQGLIKSLISHDVSFIRSGSGIYKDIKIEFSSASEIASFTADLDLIKRYSDKNRFYTPSEKSWFYLYVDKPYSTYSSYFTRSEYKQRQELWWSMHTDKLPDLIYVPFDDQHNDKIAWLNGLFDFSVCSLKAGSLLTVKGSVFTRGDNNDG